MPRGHQQPQGKTPLCMQGRAAKCTLNIASPARPLQKSTAFPVLLDSKLVCARKHARPVDRVWRWPTCLGLLARRGGHGGAEARGTVAWWRGNAVARRRGNASRYPPSPFLPLPLSSHVKLLIALQGRSRRQRMPQRPDGSCGGWAGGTRENTQRG